MGVPGFTPGRKLKRNKPDGSDVASPVESPAVAVTCTSGMGICFLGSVSAVSTAPTMAVSCEGRTRRASNTAAVSIPNNRKADPVTAATCRIVTLCIPSKFYDVNTWLLTIEQSDELGTLKA